MNEARSMAKRAFEIPEEPRMPVIPRSVTRLGHVVGEMELGKTGPQGQESYSASSRLWTPLPCLGPEQRLRGESRRAGEVLESCQPIEHHGDGRQKIGVVAAHFAFSHAQEAVDILGLRGEVALSRKSSVNPLPSAIIRRVCSRVNEVLVVEGVTPSSVPIQPPT